MKNLALILSVFGFVTLFGVSTAHAQPTWKLINPSTPSGGGSAEVGCHLSDSRFSEFSTNSTSYSWFTYLTVVVPVPTQFYLNISTYRREMRVVVSGSTVATGSSGRIDFTADAGETLEIQSRRSSGSGGPYNFDITSLSYNAANCWFT